MYSPKHYDKLRLISILSYIIGILAMVFTAIAIYNQFADSNKKEYYLLRSSDYQAKIDSLIIKINLRDKFIQDMVKSVSKDTLNNLNNYKLVKLEKSIEEIKETTLGLRQAVNPMKPNEILTIARLSDKLLSVSEEYKLLKETIAKEQENFRISVLRELDASNRSTNMILVIMVPLVGNFVYSIWKDRKSDRSDSKES